MREASTDAEADVGGSYEGADLLVFVAFLLALPGVVAGLAMITNRAPCADGTYSASGDLGTCHAHPQVWLGIGLLSVTLLLGLLALLAVSLSRKLDARGPAGPR